MQPLACPGLLVFMHMYSLWLFVGPGRMYLHNGRVSASEETVTGPHQSCQLNTTYAACHRPLSARQWRFVKNSNLKMGLWHPWMVWRQEFRGSESPPQLLGATATPQ